SGILVHTAGFRRIGEEMSIEFDIPALGMNVKCRTKVVWRQEQGRTVGTTREGLKFLDLDPTSADKIDSWIRSYLN
ncbi:MAG: PilZ domain-containing protein, partial [Nitrospirota bacterium]